MNQQYRDPRDNRPRRPLTEEELAYIARRREARERLLRRRRMTRAVMAAIFAVVLIIGGCFLVSALLNRGRIPAGSTESEAATTPSEEEILLPAWITVDLLPVNEYSRPGKKLDAMNGIVIHNTGNPGTTAEQNRSYYYNVSKTGETYVSSNFVIGIDGTVILCVPMDEVAYCSNNRNSDTLSIECCHEDESGELSEAALESLVKLCAWLCEQYELDAAEDIIRHYDITGKECPKYYTDNPEAWEALKGEIAAMLSAESEHEGE